MDLKLTRRKFLQILGAAPVAGVALNLPAAMTAIPEPTIERVVNYITDPKPKLIGGVIHLANVISVSQENHYDKFSTIHDPRVHRRFRGCTVEIEHYENPLMGEAFASTDEVAISFDTPDSRVLLVGYIARVDTFINYDLPVTQRTTVEVSEPVVIKYL